MDSGESYLIDILLNHTAHIIEVRISL